jgi:hypothetical protein
VFAASVPLPYPAGGGGFDISWPQCGKPYPARPFNVAVVGVNDGHAFSVNPCLASEARWAGRNLQLYANVNSPPAADATDAAGPAGRCPPNGLHCLAYNFGYNGAAAALVVAASQGAQSSAWWLDVETGGSCAPGIPTGNAGYWSCAPSLNSATIQGAIDLLRSHHLTVGVYTTAYQWQIVTGGYVPNGGTVPMWIAGIPADSGRVGCRIGPIAGNRPSMLQYWPALTYDSDLAC